MVFEYYLQLVNGKFFTDQKDFFPNRKCLTVPIFAFGAKTTPIDLPKRFDHHFTTLYFQMHRSCLLSIMADSCHCQPKKLRTSKSKRTTKKPLNYEFFFFHNWKSWQHCKRPLLEWCNAFTPFLLPISQKNGSTLFFRLYHTHTHPIFLKFLYIVIHGPFVLIQFE